MSAEPYTRAEMSDDVIVWRVATREQEAAAFLTLLDAAAATAYTDQNVVLIEAIREIRAGRDAS